MSTYVLHRDIDNKLKFVVYNKTICDKRCSYFGEVDIEGPYFTCSRKVGNDAQGKVNWKDLTVARGKSCLEEFK